MAQCAMALRVMVQSHVGWPWECHRSPDASFGNILDEYALHDGWHPSCYRLLWHTLLRMAGLDAIHLAELTHPEWCKRGHQGTESRHPWRASANAVGPKKYAQKNFSQAEMFFPLGIRQKCRNCDQPTRKKNQLLKSFLVVLSHWQCFFEAWQRKDFSACEKFFSHIQTYCCGPTAFG